MELESDESVASYRVYLTRIFVECNFHVRGSACSRVCAVGVVEAHADFFAKKINFTLTSLVRLRQSPYRQTEFPAHELMGQAHRKRRNLSFRDDALDEASSCRNAWIELVIGVSGARSEHE